MSTAEPRPDEKVITGLLLAVLILAAIALLREGPNYDNVLEGWRFFTTAFFTGMLLGFLGWTQAFHTVPTLSFAAPHRQLWIAAFALGLVFAVAGSWINRTFATPAGRTITAEIDSFTQDRRDRWRVTVKMPDGTYQRYVIPQDAATRLKGEPAVRLGIAHGALGFEYVATFEPAAKP